MLECNYLNIYNKVCKFISSKIETLEEEFDSEDSLFQDGIGLDSINYVELICELENEYKIEIKPAEFNEAHTLNELVSIIHEKLVWK